MSRTDFNPPQARSWRDIPQQVKPRAMSAEGRRRVWWKAVKTALGVILVAGVAWGGFEIASALHGVPKPLTSAETPPVREIDFATDGVLPKEWVVRTLNLPRGVSLMELDLYQLRGRLLATRQVRTATLTRVFPATLAVNISEQSPIARIMARRGGEEPRTLLVARDGAVFEGLGFDDGLLGTLPWLDGVSLTRSADGFAPIPGMTVVSDLLAKAKLEAEHLYRDWHVVSLARLESDGEIEVRSASVAKIRFGTQEDFFRQLARLDALLDSAPTRGVDQPLREVNLAIGAHVPVAFGETEATPPALQPVPPQTATSRSTPVLRAFPDFQRRTKL